jgi:hypothetical protein
MSLSPTAADLEAAEPEEIPIHPGCQAEAGKPLS